MAFSDVFLILAVLFAAVAAAGAARPQAARRAGRRRRRSLTVVPAPRSAPPAPLLHGSGRVHRAREWEYGLLRAGARPCSDARPQNRPLPLEETCLCPGPCSATAIPTPSAMPPSTARTGATARTSAGRACSPPRWGREWMVIEEGLGGRTTVSDDPIEGAEKNGKTYLYPCLMSHRPLDVVVIMLGTNDLKARFNKTAWEIAAGVGVLVDIVQDGRRRPQRGRARDPGGQPAADLRQLPDLCRDVHRRAAEIAPSGGRIPAHGEGEGRPFLRRRLGHQVEPGGRHPFRPGRARRARQGDRRPRSASLPFPARSGRPSLDRHGPAAEWSNRRVSASARRKRTCKAKRAEAPD